MAYTVRPPFVRIWGWNGGLCCSIGSRNIAGFFLFNWFRKHNSLGKKEVIASPTSSGFCQKINIFHASLHGEIDPLKTKSDTLSDQKSISSRVNSYAISLIGKTKTTIISIFCREVFVRNAFLNTFWHWLVEIGHQFTRSFVPNVANCVLEIRKLKFHTWQLSFHKSLNIFNWVQIRPLRWPRNRLDAITSFPFIYGMRVMNWSVVVNQLVSEFREKVNSSFFQNVDIVQRSAFFGCFDEAHRPIISNGHPKLKRPAIVGGW